MSQELANQWFARLELVLKDRKLPCEHGPARVCEASEFMFMQHLGTVASFKHRSTRNYVMVKQVGSGYELFVPFTMKAFERGFFDNF